MLGRLKQVWYDFDEWMDWWIQFLFSLLSFAFFLRGSFCDLVLCTPAIIYVLFILFYVSL